MHILQIKIENFRGIKSSVVNLGKSSVFIGPNNCGKSTIVEALALTLGRDRMIRNLTEHDFNGSDPKADTRIKIIVTIGGFPGNTPDRNTSWFRDGRAVPKWWNQTTKSISSSNENEFIELCMQIGFAARFDLESLEVETIRYFHDSDDIADPFIEDVVQKIPGSLIQDIGFFLVPSSRTWDKTISFGSELFNKVISSLGKVPSKEVLDARNKLRTQMSFDESPDFKEIVDNINNELNQLLPSSPKLKFRLTSTDSDSILKAMTPHFSLDGGCELPSSKHGSGLLSLQTMLLLLEFGKKRKKDNQNFIIAIEEPELHLPPAMQKRIIHRAYQISSQMICTSHSSRIAGFFAPIDIQVIENQNGSMKVNPLSDKPLSADTENHIRKLLNESRIQLIEGLLHPIVLISEGRIEYEWFEHFIRLTETSTYVLSDKESEGCFSAFIGVIASEGSNITSTYNYVKNFKSQLAVLVDGDDAGDGFVDTLTKTEQPPKVIIQWSAKKKIEDIIGNILASDKDSVLTFLNHEEHVKNVFEGDIASIEDIVLMLKTLTSAKTNQKGLKGNYLAYQEICSAISQSLPCINKIVELLNAIKAIILKSETPSGFVKSDKSTANTLVIKQQ